jgi:hypothetical protein
MIRSLVIRFFVLLVILAGLDLLYRVTLYPKDLRSHSKELLSIRESAASTAIYYFGESSNTTFVPEDSTRESISDLCAKFFPGLSLRNINKEATHAGIYRGWLNEFEKTGRYPKAIIITLNLRSFNAAWIHSSLENSLQESLVLSKSAPPLVNRFMLSLQNFDVRTAAEREQDMLAAWKKADLQFPYAFKYSSVRDWDNAMANGGHLTAAGHWDQQKIELACHYIKAYALSLNDANVRVQDFDAIYQWCAEHKVRLYLNLMAENVAYADSLVGKDLVFLMRRNRDFLVTRYNKEHCRVADNLEAVPAPEFIDQNWTTEHYRYYGRMVIARNLAAVIKKDFEKEYIKAY